MRSSAYISLQICESKLIHFRKQKNDVFGNDILDFWAALMI